MSTEHSNDWARSYFSMCRDPAANLQRPELANFPLGTRKLRQLYLNICLEFISAKCDGLDEAIRIAFDHADSPLTTNELQFSRSLLQNHARRLSRKAFRPRFHGTAEGGRLLQDCCGIRAFSYCLYTRLLYPADFYSNFWGYQTPDINAWDSVVDSLTPRLTQVLMDLIPIRNLAHFHNEWRDATTVPLAQTMYTSRDFTAAPILADALEDAGCNAAAILDHLRDPAGVHVRGCWAVDLVLGKS